ncbi:MAG TPA: hypothetical protein VFH06_02535 [Candidatus Saccharimonadales bacterium]|nr:hypothetical protein [Candidatus Saccharimonadales bacterium]
MALPKNRQAVQALLKELEPRVLGKERPGFSCNCGVVHCPTAVAEKIEPGGDNYPGQETNWALWSVSMKAHAGSNWSCGLSFFVEADELEAMFARHFGDQSDIEYPYSLSTNGKDRVYAQLSAAVRIQENDEQIRFCFDWGREQETAEYLKEYWNSRRVPAGTEAYRRIVSLLEDLQPETYRGGPDPELPHESTWLLDYRTALVRASKEANHIFLQGGGSFTDHRGTVYTDLDVAFMRREVQ